MGYDENYIDLIEHDSIFIGDWRTARGDDDYYVHFNINSSGTSKYQYDMKHDDRPPLIIENRTKYHDSYIYLEDELRAPINSYPTLENDTVYQFGDVIGPIYYVYSAKMVIGEYTLYRVEEVL
jgi:hypothetical protein